MHRSVLLTNMAMITGQDYIQYTKQQMETI